MMWENRMCTCICNWVTMLYSRKKNCIGEITKKNLKKKKRYRHPKVTTEQFTIAKTWKQPKCSSTEDWIKKIWYILTMDYYSAIKNNEIMPFSATWMDLEIIFLSEVSHAEKNKYHIRSLIHGIIFIFHFWEWFFISL